MSTNIITITLFSKKIVEEEKRESFIKRFRNKIYNTFDEDSDGNDLYLEDENFTFDFSKGQGFDYADYNLSVVLEFSCECLDFESVRDMMTALFKHICEIHMETYFEIDDTKSMHFWTNNKRVLKKFGETDSCSYEISKNEKTFWKKQCKLANISDEKFEASIGKEYGDDGYIDDDDVVAYLDENVEDWYHNLNNEFDEKLYEVFTDHKIDYEYVEIVEL